MSLRKTIVQRTNKPCSGYGLYFGRCYFVVVAVAVVVFVVVFVVVAGMYFIFTEIQLDRAEKRDKSYPHYVCKNKTC